jgi:hypothetical protein
MCSLPPPLLLLPPCTSTNQLQPQSKLVVDQETHQHTLATLKKAVTDQESLITRLQQVSSCEHCQHTEATCVQSDEGTYVWVSPPNPSNEHDVRAM